MNTHVVMNEVKTNPDDPKYKEILRSIHETDCRLSVIKGIISDQDIRENIAVDLSLKYADIMVEHDRMMLDYIKQFASDKCLKIINWRIDSATNKIHICEEQEVED